MSQQDQLAAFVKSANDPIQTLYLPIPIAEQWGEKARIFQQNVVNVLKNRPNTSPALMTALENLELHKIGARGLCFFAADNSVQYTRLSRRPKTIFSRGPNPLILPLLKDLDDRDAQWVLVMSKTSRSLWFVDGDDKTDWTSLLDGPDYADVRARRSVQDDIFFHSSSRGPSANVNFHALGSDVSAEEDKTTASFFQETWSAVSNAIPHQVSRLTVIAPEGTLGAFMAEAPKSGFVVTQIQSGDGLAALSQQRATPSNHDITNNTVVSLSDAKRKVQQGQIQTLIIPDRSRITAIVTSDHQGGSENLHLRIANADDKIFEYNEMAIEALKTGARVAFASQNDQKPLSKNVSVKQRW